MASNSDEHEVIERVFPIRLSILESSPFLHNISEQLESKLSVVPVAEQDQDSCTTSPNQLLTAGAGPASRSDHPSPLSSVSHNEEEPDGSLLQVPATPEIEMTDCSGSASSGDGSFSNDISRLTNKFEYALTNDGRHGVMQGTRRAFTRCEDELIHIPGAIQSFGILIALRGTSEGLFIPRIVSENSYDVCHYSPAELFALDNFGQTLPIFQRPTFNAKLREVSITYENRGKSQEPIVFDFSFSDPMGRLIPCWCAAHYLGGDTDLYVCEFELQDYSMHPQYVPVDATTEPQNPVDTLGSDHMDVATVSSLHSRSQPIFTPRSGPSWGGIDPNISSVEVVGVATNIQRQLSQVSDLQSLLDHIVGTVREISGFNRVMVYQFDHEFNGTVVAELMDPKASLDVYKGMHFPASDIPPQARQLYMINKVRVLFDRTQETARLVGRDSSDIAVPLDLTHSYLRAMSPVHLKYLANMGVRSSMSMSLEYEGSLWGLIVCHSYGPTATRVPFSIREMSYSVGMLASICLEKILNSNKLQARRIIETLQSGERQGSPNECITASSDELLRLFEADCGFLVVEGDARTIGRLSSYTEAVTLLKYLFFRASRTILFSNNIRSDFKDLHYKPGFKSIAGVLYIPLSGSTDDCVVFYRKTQIKEVHWAGRPNLKNGEFGNLEPRNSFKKWTEVVDGTSKGWTSEQANMAAMAQLVYGSFIRVWRAKENAVKETRLKRLLLHDASHQVRTPLNAVINYLEMALEKPLEDSTKHALTRSYTASKSLIYVIDDLLNLTGSSAPGSVAPLSDPFDLDVCLDEALDPLKRLAREKDIEIVVSSGVGTARYFRGDPPSLQRAVSIMVENAIEHSISSGSKIFVEWTDLQTEQKSSIMRIAVTDSGPGLSERELDDMFQEFEQVPDEDFDEASLEQTMSPRAEVLRVGVGLAFVARYVKQRSGQLKVTSAKGRGSTFAIEVPFVVASRAPSLASRRDASPLPVLPMPGPPNLCLGPGHGVGTTPSASPAVQLSPPITATTPNPTLLIPSRTTATPSASSFNIIVADDNMINVQILERRLSKMGHRVLVGRDGQDCFNIFVANQSSVDFVLMDLNMPVVDGWESARMIREQEHKTPIPSRAVQICGRTPIFAVSGMLRRSDEELYVKAGFDGLMPKPIDMKRLAVCLAGALDGHTCTTAGLYDDARFELGGWFPPTKRVELYGEPIVGKAPVLQQTEQHTSLDDIASGGRSAGEELVAAAASSNNKRGSAALFVDGGVSSGSVDDGTGVGYEDRGRDPAGIAGLHGGLN
ncbi:phytochrome-like protein [Apodospora peruviana]|uniref:Phytochrome-like protein n=1 Tax=Apodospora peruviana TaxID=516989 RepID=A0AAE0I1U3_9PEZI|nr:phytochrome-like protein [Apodospora peruviana]